MQLSNADIEDAILELVPLVRALGMTDLDVDELHLVNVEAVATRKWGTINEVLKYLRESFVFLNDDIQMPVGFEVEIAVVKDNMTRGYIEIMWGARKIGAGSISLPHVIIRRSENDFEILLPE